MSASPVCLINGVPSTCASPQERALAYGDGLFETISVVEGQPVLLDLHWDRLSLGLRRLHIPLAIETVADQLGQMLRLMAGDGVRCGVVKIIVSRGVGGRGFKPPEGGTASVIISHHARPLYSTVQFDDGLALYLCEQRLPQRPWLAGLKHLNCLEYVLARIEAGSHTVDDCLLRDERDCLVETTVANLFLVAGGCLLTPSLETCGVAGTMRRWLLDSVLPELGLAACEKDLYVADLAAADEVFVCNSVRGVMPVRSIAGFGWKRGPLTRLLQDKVMPLLHGESYVP